MHRTIYERREVYTFDELAPAARDAAAIAMCDECLHDDMRDICHEPIERFFQRSRYELVWSLGYCQGDGANLVGDFDIDELYALIGKARPDWATECSYRHDGAWGACFCDWDTETEAGYLADHLAEWADEGHEDEARADAEKICERMSEICKWVEDEGYGFEDYYTTDEAHEGLAYYEDGAFAGVWDQLFEEAAA